jgi:hypothetical protein
MDSLTTYITRLGITSNYRATGNLHYSQITTAPAKPFPACCVLTSRSLATAFNSGNSSASRTQVLRSLTSVQNCLPAIPSTELDRHFFSIILSAGQGSSLYNLGTYPIENTVSNKSSILLAFSLPRERVYRAVA